MPESISARWARFARQLKPGRAQVLLAVLAVMAVSFIAAFFLEGRPRLVAGVVFLVAFLLGGLAARWLFEPEEKSYPAIYTGHYPPLPRRDRVDVWAAPEGLALWFPSLRRTEVIRHGLIESARIEQTDEPEVRGVLQLTIADRISRSTYTASLLFRNPQHAAEVFDGLARHRYAEADAPWAMWRTINLRLQVTSEELRRGFRKTVPFTRMVACTSCYGIHGLDPRCSACAGKGYTTERDFVEVKAPPGTPIDKEFVFERVGNEDPNGRRGPVVVRLEQEKPLELDPWPQRDSEHKHV